MMANACFFNYKGTQPLGGIMAINGLIPYSYAQRNKIDPNIAVLG